jgi:hypothetical protein
MARGERTGGVDNSQSLGASEVARYRSPRTRPVALRESGRPIGPTPCPAWVCGPTSAILLHSAAHTCILVHSKLFHHDGRRAAPAKPPAQSVRKTKCHRSEAHIRQNRNPNDQTDPGHTAHRPHAQSRMRQHRGSNDQMSTNTSAHSARSITKATTPGAFSEILQLGAQKSCQAPRRRIERPQEVGATAAKSGKTRAVVYKARSGQRTAVRPREPRTVGRGRPGEDPQRPPVIAEQFRGPGAPARSGRLNDRKKREQRRPNLEKPGPWYTKRAAANARPFGQGNRGPSDADGLEKIRSAPRLLRNNSAAPARRRGPAVPLAAARGVRRGGRGENSVPGLKMDQ